MKKQVKKTPQTDAETIRSAAIRNISDGIRVLLEMDIEREKAAFREIHAGIEAFMGLGCSRQETADRIGPMIDAIANDLEAGKLG